MEIVVHLTGALARLRLFHRTDDRAKAGGALADAGVAATAVPR